jgi:hypothetical protein
MSVHARMLPGCVLETCRVDAVQQALVAFTSIAVSDQIVMCHGARLDPAKPLSAYKLPVVSGPALPSAGG